MIRITVDFTQVDGMKERRAIEHKTRFFIAAKTRIYYSELVFRMCEF